QAHASMARFAAFIKHSTEFAAQYDELADEIIDFIYRSQFKLWYEDVYNNKIPYAETGSVFWNDKASHMITTAILLYQATGDAYYKAIAERGAGLFKNTRLEENGRGWV